MTWGKSHALLPQMLAMSVTAATLSMPEARAQTPPVPRNEAPSTIGCPVRGLGWTIGTSDKHGPGQGVGLADDSAALDMNLNKPTHNTDRGMPVYAVAAGEVHTGDGWGSNDVGQLLINHTEADGARWSSGYLHLTEKTSQNRVARGELIGKIGAVGLTTVGSEHLHYATYDSHGAARLHSVHRNFDCFEQVPHASDTLPDHSLLPPHTASLKRWTVQNTGDITWDSNYCLRPMDPITLGDTVGACVTTQVKPGATYTFSVTVQTPAGRSAIRPHLQQWRLLNPSGRDLGVLSALVRVSAADSSASNPSDPEGSALIRSARPTPATPGMQGQSMTFSATLASGILTKKVEVYFPETGVTELLTEGPSNIWSRSILMSKAGNNLPFKVIAYPRTGAAEELAGQYTVVAASPSTPTAPKPVIQTVTAHPAAVTVGETILFTAALAANVQVLRAEIAFPVEGVTKPLTRGSGNTWSWSNTTSRVGADQPFEIRVVTGAGRSIASGTFTVGALPAVALTPTMTKSETVVIGVPWEVRLKTNVQVTAAELVFATGRRIPFLGGGMQWYSDDRQSVFGSPGFHGYALRIQRRPDASFETFPGGLLEVKAKQSVANEPKFASAPSADQGRPYTLRILTLAPAANVRVTWSDIGDAALTPDAQRTSWVMNRTVQATQPMGYTVRVFDNGGQVVGETRGNVRVAPAPTTLRVTSVSPRVLLRESPFFTVEASLSIDRVTVQLGGGTPTSLPSLGGNDVRGFSGPVLAGIAGAAVPYVVTGYSTQSGAALTLNGTLAVATPSDSLKLPTPIPNAGVEQGTTVDWQFVTLQQPGEMWVEFAAPIGRVSLVGTYLRYRFDAPVGTYAYRLMRRDHLGNIYPIQGGSGQLVIKPKTTVISIGAATLNGQAISAGATVNAGLNASLSLAATTVGAAQGLVLKMAAPALGDIYVRLTAASNGGWHVTSLPGGATTLAQLFRGQVAAGTVIPAQIYLGTGGTDTAVNLGGTISFNMRMQ